MRRHATTPPCWKCCTRWSTRKSSPAASVPWRDGFAGLAFPRSKRSTSTTSPSPNGSPNSRSCGSSIASSSKKKSAPSWWGQPARANLNQRSTPLVTQECEGHVTVTDPCHPLYGKTLKLAGLANLPGHVRHCQVELRPGQYGFIPVTCTNLNTCPRHEPTVLTSDAIEELVTTFQAVSPGRRGRHATGRNAKRLGPTTRKRAKRDRRRHRADSQPGGGK